MNRWHKGRVVLVGDAAWCLTPYSGMGASTGLAGSELLGNMLETYPDDVGRALVAWEEKLRPFIVDLQADGLKSRALSTPSGEAQRILRAAFLHLAGSPVTRPIFQRPMGNFQRKMHDIVVQ